jgi:zinc D-Ala-D-Ala carboxypeptidase
VIYTCNTNILNMKGDTRHIATHSGYPISHLSNVKEISLHDKVSKNFVASEFVCTCGCRSLILFSDLVDALQDLRDLVGVPIRINSGYRCPGQNKSLANASSVSKHMVGIAADIALINSPMTLKEFYNLAESIPAFMNGGIGVYPVWHTPGLHVDVRKGKARWLTEIVNGKYKYVGINNWLR